MQLFPQRTAALRRYKFINWQTVVVELVERQFKMAVAQAEAAGHYEKLYVHQNRERRSIQLFFGQHQVGPVTDGSGIALERGAALVLSQGPTGAIAVFLYPYKSELSCRHEELIVWKVFDDPLSITENVLKRAIADFTCYARVSSVLDGGTPADRRHIDRLIRRDRFQSEAKVNAAKQAEEEARQKKEVRPSWGSRLANNTWIVLFMIIGTVVTLVSGWQPSVDQVRKWRGETIPSSGQPSEAAMPLITGWYSFCPQGHSNVSTKMLNLLYDIGQYAGKVVFFDVQIQVDCVMGTASNPYAPVQRTAEEDSLTYRFDPVSESGTSLDGGRDRTRLYRFLPENGTLVHVIDDGSGRNAFTRLGINLEGTNDEIYGPYLIKARSEDSSMSFELSAPILDTAMHAAASAIAQQRSIAHENDPLPEGLPQPISLSAKDVHLTKELSTLPGAATFSKPNASPPLEAKSLSKLPPLPLPITHAPSEPGAR